MDADRSEMLSRGFLPEKTTPGKFNQVPLIGKPLKRQPEATPSCLRMSYKIKKATATS
jgi:hypothetical protein